MKMIYGGPSASSQAVPQNYLFNCIRNSTCQPEFFVPLRSITDLFLYFEFEAFGKPVDWIINLIDCDGQASELSFCNYVIARQPNGVWYGIFTGVIDEGMDLTKFRIEAQFFSASETAYKYFSQQLQIGGCDPLMKIESCYPVPDDLTRAYDCNGIYFGTHTGDTAADGNIQLRYFHQCFVRLGSVIETENKMELTIFNNQRPYRNIMTRQYVLESELIPPFYKDVLIGVVGRGLIMVNGQDQYVLEASQQIAPIDKGSQLWPPDILLGKLHRGYFGCDDTVCSAPIAAQCEGNYNTVNITNSGYIFSNGHLNLGETITWTLRDTNGAVIQTKTVSVAAGNFDAPIDLAENCYTFSWFKNCNCSLNQFPSPTKTVTVGDCGACCDPVVLSASATVIQSNAVESLSYDRGDPRRLDMFLRLVNAASIDAEFDIQVTYTLYGVEGTVHTVFTIFAGTSTRHFVAGIPYDAVINGACIYSCSDPNIDTTEFNC